MNSDAVRFELNGALTILTLNRPDTRNALSDDVVEGLIEACKRVNRDMSIACVILTAAGTAFCAGGNVKNDEMRHLPGHRLKCEGPIVTGYSKSRWQCTTSKRR